MNVTAKRHDARTVPRSGDDVPCIFSPPSKDMAKNMNAEEASVRSGQSSSRANLAPAPSSVILGHSSGAFVPFAESNRSHAPAVPSKRLLNLVTLDIGTLYKRINPNYIYPVITARRVLTKPSEPMHNRGPSGICYDNKDHYLVMFTNDILEGAPDETREVRKYRVIDSLGQGTFGQVVRCCDMTTQKLVAIKVIKNLPNFERQAKVEINMLRTLNEICDPDGAKPLLRMLDSFQFRKHLCLVFELLGANLFELLRSYNLRGISCNLIRTFSVQLLQALACLREHKIIHCDIKPENILLESVNSCRIKLVDFGSACFEGETMYSYIQSRFYRSPEVLLGLPYDAAIDMWSVGCLVAELFLGLPLFPGNSAWDQMDRIFRWRGLPPDYMLARCVREAPASFQKFFTTDNKTENGKIKYLFKTFSQFAREHKEAEKPRSYPKLHGTSIDDVILNYPYKQRTEKEIAKEKNQRTTFIHFIKGLLQFDPKLRYTPQEALYHPFVRGLPQDQLSVFDQWLSNHRASVMARASADNIISNGGGGQSLPVASLGFSLTSSRPSASSASASAQQPLQQSQPHLPIPTAQQQQHQQRGNSNNDFVSANSQHRPPTQPAISRPPPASASQRIPSKPQSQGRFGPHHHNHHRMSSHGQSPSDMMPVVASSSWPHPSSMHALPGMTGFTNRNNGPNPLHFMQQQQHQQQQQQQQHQQHQQQHMHQFPQHQQQYPFPPQSHMRIGQMPPGMYSQHQHIQHQQPDASMSNVLQQQHQMAARMMQHQQQSLEPMMHESKLSSGPTSNVPMHMGMLMPWMLSAPSLPFTTLQSQPVPQSQPQQHQPGDSVSVHMDDESSSSSPLFSDTQTPTAGGLVLNGGSSNLASHEQKIMHQHLSAGPDASLDFVSSNVAYSDPHVHAHMQSVAFGGFHHGGVALQPPQTLGNPAHMGPLPFFVPQNGPQQFGPFANNSNNNNRARFVGDSYYLAMHQYAYGVGT